MISSLLEWHQDERYEPTLVIRSWIVDENGVESWVRLESLQAGMKVRSLAELGGESPAMTRAATSLQKPKADVCLTTTRRDGLRGTEQLPTINSPEEPCVSS